jgi:hypothetical protein
LPFSLVPHVTRRDLQRLPRQLATGRAHRPQGPPRERAADVATGGAMVHSFLLHRSTQQLQRLGLASASPTRTPSTLTERSAAMRSGVACNQLLRPCESYVHARKPRALLPTLVFARGFQSDKPRETSGCLGLSSEDHNTTRDCSRPRVASCTIASHLPGIQRGNAPPLLWGSNGCRVHPNNPYFHTAVCWGREPPHRKLVARTVQSSLAARAHL